VGVSCILYGGSLVSDRSSSSSISSEEGGGASILGVRTDEGEAPTLGHLRPSREMDKDIFQLSSDAESSLDCFWNVRGSRFDVRRALDINKTPGHSRFNSDNGSHSHQFRGREVKHF
jgi:hypothetical protein